MFDHLIFIFFLVIFLFSNIGYGYIFSRIIQKKLTALNFGYLGIIGFFAISFVSIFSSFLFKHGYAHNFILHLIGISSFLLFFSKSVKKNLFQIKKLMLIFLVLLIGIYVYKNHDDFPYYHLTYALNLSENKFMIGTGAFSHGFKTFSSLFFYNSTLYLPFIKYYLFHSGPFFILIFFNYIMLSKIFFRYKQKKSDFLYFFLFLSLIFVNVVFYRIGEHGTDRSPQILLILIFMIMLETFYSRLNLNKQKNLFNFLLVTILLAASIKQIYFLYFVIIPILLFKNKFFKNFLVIQNLKLILFLFLSFSSLLTVSFFNSGCLLFPAEKSCFENYEWSTSKKEAIRMKTHFEWWSKAGGGPGYRAELEPEQYVKNFVWVENWIKRHFFNKVLDTLLGILFISMLTFLIFRTKSKKKTKQENFIIIYFILFLFFCEWFLNHPQMRYGGFILFAIPIFIFFSRIISSYSIDKKKLFNGTLILLILTLSTYNIRNIIRIQKEQKVYKYNILKSPYFFVEKVKTKVVYEDKDLKIYKPTNTTCWNAPTPCSYRENVSVKKLYGFNVIINNDK